ARCRSPRRWSCGRTAPRGRSTRATARPTTEPPQHDRVRPGRRPMTLQLHRPDGEGGLEPVPPADADWRTQLQSPRWGTSLEGDRLPRLGNPEMNPTSRFRSVLFWLGLGI